MWEAVQLVAGEWTKLATDQSLDACKGAAAKSDAAKGKGEIFYFWAGGPPADEKEAHRVVDEVLAANNGRVERAMVGIKAIVKNDVGAFTCPGNCFCVIAHGMRRCETSYCNENGYCWWVPCGMGC